MNALFAWFLILATHVARGLLNLQLIPVITLWLAVWSVHRVFGLERLRLPRPRFQQGGAGILNFFHRWIHWTQLACMTLKSSLSPSNRVILGNPASIKVLYAIALCPVFLRALSPQKKTFLLAGGALIFYLLNLYADPAIGIDVYVANNLGLDHLFSGLNPYSQNYPEALSGGRGYRPGFLYWPGTLYLEALSRLLFGDIRVVLVLCWWLAPFLFPKRASPLEDVSLKATWWFLPFLSLCLRCGWIDPILSFCAAALVFGILRKRWWVASFAIALAASVKQYGGLLGVFAVPYLLLTGTDRTPALRTTLRSAVIFALLLLPFLIWDLRAFLDMTVLSHLDAVTRLDALNFTSWWTAITGREFVGAAQGIMTLTGFVIAFLHLVRNAKREGLKTLPEAWAIAFGFSVVFGKFGFINYYWLWISFLILAIALEKAPIRTPDRQP